MKKVFVLLVLLIMLPIIIAEEDHAIEVAEGKALVDSQISCDDLTEEQLEVIGEYYMEQMHPGEAHEVMDERMGGEGSESLRLAHINMGLRFYCNQGSSMMGGMMGILGSGNMMNNDDFGGETMAYGMMGSYGLGSSIYGAIFFAIAVFIFSVIFWSTRNWLVKETKKKRK